MPLFSGIGGATAWYVSKRVGCPINKISETMRLVAAGNLTCEIPFGARDDEIGTFSRALRVFRDNAIERQKLYLETDRDLAKAGKPRVLLLSTRRKADRRGRCNGREPWSRSTHCRAPQ